MEESVFWNKLAKYLSKNSDKEEQATLESVTRLNGNKQALKDASAIFGKSEKEIEESFEQLSKKTEKG